MVHEQLGYSGLTKLKKIVQSLKQLSSLKCKSCQLGKHTRQSSPYILNKGVSYPFSLVHFIVRLILVLLLFLVLNIFLPLLIIIVYVLGFDSIRID